MPLATSSALILRWHTLAQDIGSKLEFVPIVREQMAEQLKAGYCDIIMSGVVPTPERAPTPWPFLRHIWIRP